jgi:hypothetical protein
MVEAEDKAGGGTSDSKRQQVLEELADPSRLSQRLQETLCPAIDAFQATHGKATEVRATLLVSWEGEGELQGQVSCHVAALPPPPTPPICVEVRRVGGRENPLAKDSHWVRRREDSTCREQKLKIQNIACCNRMPPYPSL